MSTGSLMDSEPIIDDVGKLMFCSLHKHSTLVHIDLRLVQGLWLEEVH